MGRQRRHGEWWQNWTADGRPRAAAGGAFEGRFIRLFESVPEEAVSTPEQVTIEPALHELALAMTADPEPEPTSKGQRTLKKILGLMRDREDPRFSPNSVSLSTTT